MRGAKLASLCAPARRVPPLTALALLISLPACSTLPNGRGWGEDATLTPGWQRVRAAAAGAVQSPRFWGPLVAAGILQIDGWDRKVSNWARTETPLFGSEQNAAAWSNRLRAACGYLYVASVLATPSEAAPREWLLNKLRGAAVGAAAIGVTDAETALLKSATARERPNGQDTQSMPSAHSSRAAVLSALTERNLESLDLGEPTRRALTVGLDAITYLTAWARVESGFHFPSDTLVGISLGNVNGAFFNDAFLGLDHRVAGLAWSLAPAPGRGALLQAEFAF